MRKPVPALIVALLLWLLLGAFIRSYYCCSATSGLQVYQGTAAVLSLGDGFACEYGTGEIQLDEKTKAEYDRLKSYLEAHPQHILLLTGTSIGGNNEDNHAVDRANYLKEELVKMGFSSDQIAVSENSPTSVSPSDLKPRNCVKHNLLASSTFIEDDSGFRLKVDKGFNFGDSGFEILNIEQLGEADSLNSLMEYLADKRDLSLSVRGKYGLDETNNSLVTNLGIARANGVRTHFINRGMDPNQIITNSALDSSLVSYNNRVFNAIDLSIVSRPKDVLLEKPKEGIQLLFESSESEVTLDQAQRLFFEQSIAYLEKNTEARMVITGHADRTGTRSQNMKLSQERADFIRNFISDRGISASRIETKAMGSNKPIARNNSKQGRAMNRRVKVELLP